MKIRNGFVTNSSSASFIVCFARVENEEKAKKIAEKHEFTLLSKEEVEGYKHCGEYGAYWAGAVAYSVDDVMREHPESKFVYMEDYNEADYDEDGDPIYDYDFKIDSTIAEITEQNGFVDIEISEGEGFDG